MKLHRTLLKGLAILAVMPLSAAFAQESSLTDAISGNAIPLTIRPIEITSDFKAVKITQSGTGDSLGLNAMMPTLMAVGAVNNMGAPAALFLEILPISWTKGQLMEIMGQSFLITYGIDMGPATLKGMSNSKKLPAFSLRLKLIKTSDIGSITPLPEWSKEKYMRAMAQVADMPATAPVAAMREHSVRISVPTPILSNESTVRTGDTSANIAPGGDTAVKGVSVSRPIDATLYEAAEQNAKSLASAMLLYAQDYDETFPYVQSTKGAEYVIYPYVKNSGVYQTLNPVRPGEFRFNMCLAGVKMDDMVDPSSTPVFYDPFAWPNGTYLVAFADSHVKFVNPDQWETIKKNLILKLKRDGQPLPANLGLPDVTAVPAPGTGPARPVKLGTGN